jgi:hypothetical protein
METHPKLEKLLRTGMSLDNSDISEPDLSLISEARQLVALRKKAAVRKSGLLESILSFFTMNIKVYQAALSTIVMGGFIFYFLQVNTLSDSDSTLTQANTHNNSVKSSTVLTSILTLVARD